jgi:hypothetical protein
MKGNLMKKQLFVSVLLGLIATSSMAQMSESTFNNKVASKMQTNQIVNCWLFAAFLNSGQNVEVKKMGAEIKELYQPIAIAKLGSESAFEGYLQKNMDTFKTQAKKFQAMEALQMGDFYLSCLLKASDAYLSVK